jgi:hypothetical protein
MKTRLFVTMTTSTEQTEKPVAVKAQPWKAIWPAPRESQPQAQIFGFKKGETMVFDGNAGNFFVRDGWVLEQESAKALKAAQDA